jgi:urease accessory protein UreH
LRFEKGQMRVERQDPPWKVVRAFLQEGGTVLVHLHNVSGGVLAGDQLALGIEISAGASAQITTTGATRLYRHRAGSPDSRQCTDIAIGEGALLEYLPDPIIPYAGSRHRQRTVIRLAAGAALFWWEVLTPGRQAGGEVLRLNKEEGLTVLLVEQKLPFARRVASEFCILDKGRRVAAGEIGELTDEVVRAHLSV